MVETPQFNIKLCCSLLKEKNREINEIRAQYHCNPDICTIYIRRNIQAKTVGTYDHVRRFLKHLTDNNARFVAGQQRLAGASEEGKRHGSIFDHGADEFAKIYPDAWNVDHHFIRKLQDAAKTLHVVVDFHLLRFD